MSANSSLCELAYDLNHDPRLLIVNSVHLLLAVCALVCTGFYLRTPSVRRAFAIVGLDLKIVLWIGIGYYAYGLCWGIGVYSFRFVTILRQAPACDFVWTGKECWWAYGQFIPICLYAYCTFHAALLIERATAIVFQRAEQKCCWLGVCLGAILLLFPNTYVYLEHYGQFGFVDQAYCASLFSNRAASGNTGLFHNLGMWAFDVLLTVGDFFLLLYNRKRIARYYCQVSDVYSLNRSFGLREIKISIELIFPFTVGHSISFTVQFCTTSFYALIGQGISTPVGAAFGKEFFNCIRTACTLSQMLGLCVYHRWGKGREASAEWTAQNDSADRYFQEFKRMIA